MARSATTTRRSRPPDIEQDDELEQTSGRLGGMLRGSMSSVMGSVGGLNLPLRTVERLTKALERASVMMERLEETGTSARVISIVKRIDRITKSVEQSTRHLDKLDADFVDRLNKALVVLVDMRQDTRAMRRQLDSLEQEVHGVQTVLTERLDRVPLLRPKRRERKAAKTATSNSAPGA